MKTIYPRVLKATILVLGLMAIPYILSAQTGMGVGTNTPAEKLDVNGAVKIGTTSTTNAGTIRWTGTEFQGYDGSQWLNFGGGNAGWSLTGNSGTTPGTNFLGTTDNQALRLRTNNTDRLTILAGGNLGIGTTNPSGAVEIYNAAANLRITDSDDNSSIVVVAPGGSYTGGIGTTTNHDLPFFTNNTDRMIITTSGNVGIGTSSPNYEIQVRGGNDNTWMQFSTNATGNGALDGFLIGVHETNNDVHLIQREASDMIFRTNNTEAMRINASGNVGIGTTNAQEKVHIRGGDLLLDRGGSGNVTRSIVVQGAAPLGNHYFGELMFKGYDNTSGSFEYEGAAIKARNLGSVNNGTLTFWTRDTSLVEWMILDKNGVLQINPNSYSGNSGLSIEGSFKLENGSQASGYVLQSDANGTATWVDPLTITAANDTDWTVVGNNLYNANTGKIAMFNTNPRWPVTMGATDNVFTGTDTIDPDLYGVGFTRESGNNNEGIGIGFGSSSSGLHSGAGIVFKKTGNNSVGDLMLAVKQNGTSFGPHFPALTIKGLSGNTGIGTTNPQEKLEVQGSIRMVDGNQANGYIPVSNANGKMTWTDPSSISTADDGDWTVNGNNQYSAVSGNVGVGVNTPTEKLHVSNGDVLFDRDTDNSNTIRTLTIAGKLEGNVYPYASMDFRNYDYNDGDVDYVGASIRSHNEGASDDGDLRFYTANDQTLAEAMRISRTGNIGVGTGTPESLLNIKVNNNGLNAPLTIRNGNDTQTGGNAVGIAFTNNNGAAAPKAMIVNERTTGWGKGSFHFLLNEDNNASAATLADAKMTIANNGRVGIGTTSPGSKLEVQGSIRMVDGNQSNGYIPVSDANGTMTWTDPATITTADDWSANGSHIYNANSGNVGIGTSLPNFELHVHDNTTDNSWLQFTQASTGTNSSTDGLLIGIDNSERAVIQNRENTDMMFYTNNTEQVRITAAGNVGIGTSTPESLLNLKVNNNGLNTPLTIRNGNDAQTGGNAVGIAFVNNNGAAAPKAMIVNERTTGWGKGSLHFLLNDDNNANAATLADARMTITRAGNVGIGTTDPNDELEVQGSIRMVDGNQAAGYIPVSNANGKMTWTDPTTITTADDGDWAANGSHIYNANSGNVGIGTSSPNFGLHVHDGSADNSWLQFTQASTGTNSSTDGLLIGIDNFERAVFQNRENTDMIFQTNSTEQVRITAAGNVGIGTSDPSELLYLRRDGSDNFIRIDSRSNSSGYAGIRLAEPGLEYGWSMRFDASPAGGLHFAFNDNAPSTTDRVTILPDGKVGIGTTNPGEELEVQGSIRMVDGNQANGYIPVSNANGTMTWTDPTTITTADDGDWTISGNDQYSSASGNVGVGSNAPGYKLDVNGTLGASGGGIFGNDVQITGNYYLDNTNGTGTNNPDFRLDGYQDKLYLIAESGTNGPATGTEIRFRTANSNGTATDKMVIKNDGNVGIGTTNPQEKMQIETASNALNLPLLLHNSANTSTGGTAVGIGFLNESFGVAPKAAIVHERGNSWGTGDMHFMLSNSSSNSSVTLADAQMTITRWGNVGIGTTNPADKLEVQGPIRMVDGNQQAGYIPVSDANGTMTWTAPTTITTADDGDWLENGNHIYNGNTGNVGIGTSSPSSALYVAANSANGPTVTIETGSNQYPSSLRILPSTHATSERATVRIGEWGLLQDIIGNGNENFAIYNNATNSHALSIDQANKIGVGTTSPDWRFSVSDNEINAGFGVTSDGDGIDLIWKNYGGVKDLDFRFQNNGGTIDTTLMTIQGNGGYNVGIGELSPAEKLHVVGNIRMVDGNQTTGYIPVSDASGTMTWMDPSSVFNDSDWTVNGNDQYSAVSGNVGIGTSTPTAALNVYEPDESTTQANFTQALNNAGVLITSQYTNGAYTPGLFWNTSNNNSTLPKAGIYSQNTNSGSKLLFGTSNSYGSGITNTGLVVSETGRVGIGTTSPADELEVQGSIRMVDGNQQTGYVAVSDANGTMSWVSPTTLTTANDGDWAVNGSHIYNANGGNVGIGTNNPSYKLHVTDDMLIESAAGAELNLYNSSSGHTWQVVSGVSQGFEIGNVTTGNIDNNAFFYIDESGNVGIGTTNPTNALLEVDGSVGSHSLSGIGYLNSGGAGTGSYNGSFSIYANGRISGVAFIAHSDERIKDIKGISDGTEDLETLRKIHVTDYQYIDKIGKGDGMQKKLIAQQVEEVYPQAVETNVTEVVPDIYEKATIKDGWVSLFTDLKVGDMVQLILKNGEELLEVKEISKSGFKVELDTEGEIFVYGRQVDDFHTVDYEAVSMLNVSATQELARRLEEVEAKNAALESKLKTLEAQLIQEKSDNQARLERLEAELGIGLRTQK